MECLVTVSLDISENWIPKEALIENFLPKQEIKTRVDVYFWLIISICKHNKFLKVLVFKNNCGGWAKGREKFFNQHSPKTLLYSLSPTTCTYWPWWFLVLFPNYCCAHHVLVTHVEYSQFTDFNILCMLRYPSKVGYIVYCEDFSFLLLVALKVPIKSAPTLNDWVDEDVIKWSALERLINLAITQRLRPWVSPSAHSTGTPGTRHCHACIADCTPGSFCVCREWS